MAESTLMKRQRTLSVAVEGESDVVRGLKATSTGLRRSMRVVNMSVVSVRTVSKLVTRLTVPMRLAWLSSLKHMTTNVKLVARNVVSGAKVGMQSVTLVGNVIVTSGTLG